MRYSVTALDPAAGLVSLTLDAASEAELREKIVRQGLTAIRIAPRRLFNLKPRKHFNLALFSHELKALLGAGLSVVEGLETLLEKSPQGETRRVLEGVNQRIREGRTLSESIEAEPTAFPQLYVASLRAAERLLRPDGRLAGVSFHSLEDRWVKRFLAQRAVAEAGEGLPRIIERMQLLALARPPGAERLKQAVSFVEARETVYAKEAGAANSPRHRALTDLAHVLFNSSEFIYIE